MSTRCQIAFYEKDAELSNPKVILYRHSDGYPSSVLTEMMPFLAWFSRVSDIEYTSARLLQYLTNLYDQYTVSWDSTSEEEKETTKKWTGVLGYGISKAFHWDIEYIYAIKADCVEVHSVLMGDTVTDNAKLLGTIPLKDFEQSKDYQKLITE